MRELLSFLKFHPLVERAEIEGKQVNVTLHGREHLEDLLEQAGNGRHMQPEKFAHLKEFVDKGTMERFTAYLSRNFNVSWRGGRQPELEGVLEKH